MHLLIQKTDVGRERLPPHRLRGPITQQAARGETNETHLACQRLSELEEPELLLREEDERLRPLLDLPPPFEPPRLDDSERPPRERLLLD
jgi:hypothetical protein